jgi:hypothetical protein
MKFPNKRRIFCRRDWTEAWANGDVELHVKQLGGGGRIVRPKGCAT